MQVSETILRNAVAVILACGFVGGFVGCENKEKILDIKTPNGHIEVERSRTTGEVDVDVNKDRP